MKSLAALLLGLFCTFGITTFGQTIEVIAEQKVKLKPLAMVYIVGLEDEMSALTRAMKDLEMSLEDEEPEPQDIPTLDDLESTLEQQKFKCTRVEREMSILGGAAEVLQINLNGAGELARLQKVLDTFETAEGMVEHADFEDPSLYFNEAYPQLVAKAKQEAELMAKASGKTVGSLLAIQEMGGEVDVWHSLINGYGQLFRKAGLSKEMGFDPTIQEVEFRYMFRFELK